jgi:hypothetical protein
VFIDGAYFPTGAVLPPGFHAGQLTIGTSGADSIVDASAGDMTIIAAAGGDSIMGGAGNDAIDGGADIDTAIYSGARASYLFTDLGGGLIQVVDKRGGSPDGTDTVQNVENFQFSDGTFTSAQVLVNNAPVIGVPVKLPAIQVNSGADLITQAQLLSNASDNDGPSALVATNLAIAAGKGSLVDNHNGTWSYTPATNDDTDVSFTYQVTDGSASVADSATLDVTSAQAAPVVGSPGNDSFSAPTGNSQFTGGLGVDTISFNFRLVDATVSYSGNMVTIDGPTSHTVLNGFEVYQFTDGTVHNDDGSPLIDDLFYYARYHDVWAAGVDADAHYNANGWKEGRDPSAFFSTKFYLTVNQDVKASGANPLTQFDQTG